MAERSKRIMLYDKDKIEKINEETKKLMKIEKELVNLKMSLLFKR